MHPVQALPSTQWGQPHVAGCGRSAERAVPVLCERPASAAPKGSGTSDSTRLKLQSGRLWARAFVSPELFLVCVHRQHTPKCLVFEMQALRMIKVSC